MHDGVLDVGGVPRDEDADGRGVIDLLREVLTVLGLDGRIKGRPQSFAITESACRVSDIMGGWGWLSAGGTA